MERSEGEQTFVTTGLAEGELVVVSTLEAAVDGMSVQLAQPMTPVGEESGGAQTEGSTAVGHR